MMQQVAYAVIGNDTSVSLAAMGGQLEINHFEPIIASRMFDSLNLLTHGSDIFAKSCVAGIRALEAQALDNLLGSSALATAFVPKLGYTTVSKIVKNAEASGKTFVEAATELGLLTQAELEELLYRAAGVGPETSVQ